MTDRVWGVIDHSNGSVLGEYATHEEAYAFFTELVGRDPRAASRVKIVRAIPNSAAERVKALKPLPVLPGGPAIWLRRSDVLAALDADATRNSAAIPTDVEKEAETVSKLGDAVVWLLYNGWSLDRVLSQAQLAAVQEFDGE